MNSKQSFGLQNVYFVSSIFNFFSKTFLCQSGLFFFGLFACLPFFFVLSILEIEISDWEFKVDGEMLAFCSRVAEMTGHVFRCVMKCAAMIRALTINHNVRHHPT